MANFKIARGTQSAYNAITNKDTDTIYVCTYTGNIYLGSKALFESDAFTNASISGKTITFTTHGANGTTETKTISLTEFATTSEVQSAKTDPSASGTSVTFIDSITQNENGEMTATKKTVQSASGSQAGLMSSIHYTKLEGIAANAQVNVLEGVQVNGTDLPISSKKVNIVTNTAYNSSTNKIATMTDVANAAFVWGSF